MIKRERKTMKDLELWKLDRGRLKDSELGESVKSYWINIIKNHTLNDDMIIARETERGLVRKETERKRVIDKES